MQTNEELKKAELEGKLEYIQQLAICRTKPERCAESIANRKCEAKHSFESTLKSRCQNGVHDARAQTK